MKLFISVTMNRNSGEGRRFFPSFYNFRLFLPLFLGIVLFLPPQVANGQKTAREELSRFDRLAEEATLLNKRGQYDQVVALLEPLKGDPKNDSPLFFNELGVAYRSKGNLPQAIQSYQAGLARAPENPVVAKNLGDAFVLNRDYNRAIEIYQKALRTNPRFQQAHYSLGVAYYQLQKYKEALEEFEIALRQNPKDPQAKKFRDEILRKSKNPTN